VADPVPGEQITIGGVTVEFVSWEVVGNITDVVIQQLSGFGVDEPGPVRAHINQLIRSQERGNTPPHRTLEFRGTNYKLLTMQVWGDCSVPNGPTDFNGLIRLRLETIP
jgi:hypothetical protein